MGHKRHVKVVNTGNTNGSALLGILYEVASPASNEIHFEKQVTDVLRIKANFRTRLANERGVCLGNTVLKVAGGRITSGVSDVVRFSRYRGFVSAPMGHCSSNVFMGLTFTITTRLSTRVVVVSRILTIKSVRFRGGYVKGVHSLTARRSEAILCISRGVGAVHSLYSEYVILSRNGVIFSNSIRSTMGVCLKDTGRGFHTVRCIKGRRGRRTSEGSLYLRFTKCGNGRSGVFCSSRRVLLRLV